MPDLAALPLPALLPPLLSLTPARIDIWLTSYQAIDDAALLATLSAMLNDDERARQARFHFAEDRLRFLVTRALVRVVLSRYAPLDPREWVFQPNAHGKPGIANRHHAVQNLCFNLSHTRGLIALAVSSGRQLGIDVENIQTRQVSEDIAAHFFAPVEIAHLAQVPAEQRQERFFEYWTFKEAYIKARGLGLSIALEEFHFQFPDEQTVRLAIDPALGDDAARWALWQCRPSAEHLLAVCGELTSAGAPELTVRSIVPTVSAQAVTVQWLKQSHRPG